MYNIISTGILGLWLLAVLFITRPPSGPSRPAPVPAQYEFRFEDADMVDPRCPWTVTPCGRPTYVRAWSDTH